jgi:hypothetical protein
MAGTDPTNRLPEDARAPGRGGAAWVWWGLAGGFLAVVVLAVLYAGGRMPHDGRNRGPGDEAAPGSEPARTIDRSKAP